jgi:hypothetical protein
VALRVRCSIKRLLARMNVRFGSIDTWSPTAPEPTVRVSGIGYCVGSQARALPIGHCLGSPPDYCCTRC